MNGQPNTAEITYNPSTKTVSWSSKYSYNSRSCTVLLKSEIITNSLLLFPGDNEIKNYTLFLTFKPVEPNQICTRDVGVSNFSGSQQLETTTEILKNFNSAFEFVGNL